MTKKLVPEVKEALNRFKIETAKEIELGVTSFNNPKNLPDKLKLNPDKSFNPHKL